MRKPSWWHWWTPILLAIPVLIVLAIPTGYFWTLARPVLHKDVINRYASVYKFDPLFVMALVKVESRFQKTARSHRGAIGLMQLMPDTAMEMARRMGMRITVEDVLEPEINILLGFHYLSWLREEFDEDVVAMLAGYNAGPTKTREWMQAGPLTIDTIPFQETREFVKNVLATHRWLKRFQKMKRIMDAHKVAS